MNPEIKNKIFAYESMIKIRLFEEKALELYNQNLIKGSLHTYIGQEAIAVGVCLALDIKKGDGIISNHRGHGHFIAMGGDIKLMISELLGKVTGYCKGKGGSMHIADIDIGIYGANGIVGGGIPIACGLALALKLKQQDGVAVSFFGDGAANQGVFYESLNLSSVWKLPVVFICENNLYSQTTPIVETLAGGSVVDRISGFNMEGLEVDGNDIEKVYKTSKYAIDKARSKKVPILIEAKTYRWKGHWQGDPEVYRKKEEVEIWKKKCPIEKYENKLIRKYGYDYSKLKKLKDKTAKVLNEAVEFAIKSKEPNKKTLMEDIYI